MSWAPRGNHQPRSPRSTIPNRGRSPRDARATPKASRASARAAHQKSRRARYYCPRRLCCEYQKALIDCIFFFRIRGVLWHRRPRGAQRGRDDRCLGLHRLHAVHHGADRIRRIAHDEAQLALEAQDGAQSGLGAQRHSRRRGVLAQIAHKARGQARHRTRYARAIDFPSCCSPSFLSPSPHFESKRVLNDALICTVPVRARVPR